MRSRNHLLLVAVGCVFLACGRTPNPDVCCVSQADCNALGVEEPVRTCADGLVCKDHACVPPLCELDVDCGSATPFCNDGLCVGCRDDGDCSGIAPICDTTESTCRACVADADCDSSTCNFETGACIPAADVTYASPSGLMSADCSQQTPCAISKAISAASVARPTVRLLPGVYNASLTLDGPIALHGEGATLVATDGTGLYVVDAAIARVYDLVIVKESGGTSSNQKYGVLCESADGVNTPKLSLVRAAIEVQEDTQFGPRAMHINLCKLTATQTTLRAPLAHDERYLLLAANGGSATFDRSKFEGGGGIATLDAM